MMNRTNHYHSHVTRVARSRAIDISKINPHHNYLNELLEIYFK